MFRSRRQLLLSVLASLGAVWLRPRSLAAQEGGSVSISPPRVVERKTPPDPDPATKALLLEQNHKAMKKDMERLLDLVTQLKSDFDKTDPTAVLSLPLVKKAEEIEKLAKQVKKHAQALTALN